MSTTEREQRVAGPDWTHDPRDTDAVHARQERRTRWTRAAAAVVAVLLVVGGILFLGYVTGRVSIPGLGTLTRHPASVASFRVESTTYLMQEQETGSIAVSQETAGNSIQILAHLPVPAADGISATNDPTRTTYFVVLPPGAHDAKSNPNDPGALVTDVIAGVPSAQSGPASVGLVARVHTAPNPTTLAVPGLASVRWVDADGTVHESELPG